MKHLKRFLLMLLGISIGWISIPIVSASLSVNDPSDVRSYMAALRKILVAVSNIEQTSKETAENTAAIRKAIVGDVK